MTTRLQRFSIGCRMSVCSPLDFPVSSSGTCFCQGVLDNFCSTVTRRTIDDGAGKNVDSQAGSSLTCTNSRILGCVLKSFSFMKDKKRKVPSDTLRCEMGQK